jgi:hypothetical protein
VFGMSRHVASPSRGVQSTVRNRRVDRKFKPRVLRQIQTGADTAGRRDGNAGIDAGRRRGGPRRGGPLRGGLSKIRDLRQMCAPIATTNNILLSRRLFIHRIAIVHGTRPIRRRDGGTPCRRTRTWLNWLVSVSGRQALHKTRTHLRRSFAWLSITVAGQPRWVAPRTKNSTRSRNNQRVCLPKSVTYRISMSVTCGTNAR